MHPLARFFPLVQWQCNNSWWHLNWCMIDGAATLIMDHIQIIGRVVLVLMKPRMHLFSKISCPFALCLQIPHLWPTMRRTTMHSPSLSTLPSCLLHIREESKKNLNGIWPNTCRAWCLPRTASSLGRRYLGRRRIRGATTVKYNAPGRTSGGPSRIGGWLEWCRDCGGLGGCG